MTTEYKLKCPECGEPTGLAVYAERDGNRWLVDFYADCGCTISGDDEYDIYTTVSDMATQDWIASAELMADLYAER